MPVGDVIERVKRLAREYCTAKGYTHGPNWNPLEPQDPVAAFAMARWLVGLERFDHYVAVAPEGHAYGFFFERLGVAVGSVFVDYPPTGVTEADGLTVVAGKRVLLIEDDVISGVSLGLIFGAMLARRPASVSVYLGREAAFQFPENVPVGAEAVYLAETHLNPADRPRHEAEFVSEFGCVR